jgi:hypothetical protein
MKYPYRICECVGEDETLLVTMDEADNHIKEMKKRGTVLGLRTWSLVMTNCNSAIYQFLNAFILVEYSKINPNFFVFIKSASNDYRDLLEMELA